MTRTVADASRDYRKRRADRLGKYEAALREIAALENTVSPSNASYMFASMARIARNALNPVASGGDE